MSYASESEKVNVSFVKAAKYVWDKFFFDPVIRAGIIRLEENNPGKTPFDSVYKLEAIGQKVKGNAKLAWVIHALADLCKAGLATSGELSQQALTGKGRRCSRRPLLHSF